jgi:aldehyde dehydrogenase (NAD+)
MHKSQFYIDGQWVAPLGSGKGVVVNPATEEVIASVALGNAGDVDRAVMAARRAFESFSLTTRGERIDLLKRIIAGLEKRRSDFADAMTSEMGAPASLSLSSQAQAGVDHFATTLAVLEDFAFEELRGNTLICREPIGVVGMITPWNWPLNQIACKVAPALAAGCTMVLKPSEIAPLNALIFAEVMDEAGVPPGVFNLVNGTGAEVGAAMSSHPGIDMMTFTGSTRAGIDVARAAAFTVKRVAQELGGKSANILLPDVDLNPAVTIGVKSCFSNSGQSCSAPTRMLVPRGRMAEAAGHAKAAAESLVTGNPLDMATDLGPVVTKMHFNKIQGLIAKGIEEGAELVAGGLGLPANLNRGYFVRPTVFANVDMSMTVAREEIFGPVIALIPYDDVEDAIRIANDSEYGLAGYVQSADHDQARAVARRIRAGAMKINYPTFDYFAPFGGYKQSGNGREYGEFGLLEFLEIKAIMGWIRG